MKRGRTAQDTRHGITVERMETGEWIERMTDQTLERIEIKNEDANGFVTAAEVSFLIRNVRQLTASLAEVTREEVKQLQSKITTLEVANKELRELLKRAQADYRVRCATTTAGLKSMVTPYDEALTALTPNAERTDGERRVE